MKRPSRPRKTGPHPDAKQTLLAGRRSRHATDRIDDRRDSQEARNDREQDRGPYSDDGNQSQRKQRPADRAEVVHRALEPVCTAVASWRNRLGQQRVPRRNSQTSRGPSPCSQHADLPRSCRDANESRKNCRRGVAGDSRRPSPARIVGQRTPTQSSGPRKPIRDALDQPEGGSRSTERRGQEARQQRRGNLVTEICKQARCADPAHTGGEPVLTCRLYLVQAAATLHVGSRCHCVSCETEPEA